MQKYGNRVVSTPTISATGSKWCFGRPSICSKMTHQASCRTFSRAGLLINDMPTSLCSNILRTTSSHSETQFHINEQQDKLRKKRSFDMRGQKREKYHNKLRTALLNNITCVYVIHKNRKWLQFANEAKKSNINCNFRLLDYSPRE